uniref:Uncharacterized protein n=1 Tax=Panagrolaimus sp. ES5 TaxID=591445 RepID=A0AC34GST2_9BILA
MSIKCSQEDDIFTTKEKTGPITLDIPFNEALADYEYDNDVRIQLEGRFDTLIIERNDEENMQVSLTARFFRYKSDIMIFDDGRKHLCSLSFQTEEIAEKVMKIVWKYKNKEVEVENIVDPLYTSTHSYHDLAVIFSYEEKTDPIKASTSDGSLSDNSCTIFIDIEKEVIVVTATGFESMKVSFSQFMAQKDTSLFFKLGADSKLKLQFDDTKTAEKVGNMIHKVKETSKSLKAEETTLTLSLEKLEDDPRSLEDVKDLIKYYSKIFTIFKEKHQNRIYELYQKYDFHEKILSASESRTVETGDVEMKALNNGTPNSRKRKAVTYDPVPAKKVKKDDSEIIFYPDFEFQCDSEGVPKKELVVFASKTKCYKFSLDLNGYVCAGCTGVESVKAKYYVNEYGETFIKTKGKHDCRPVLHKPEKLAAEKMPLFEFFFVNENRKSASSKKLRIFTPSKNASYEYVHLEDSETELWYCVKCKIQGKYVYSHLEKGPDGEQLVTLLDEDHVCIPEGYKLPEKVVESEKEDFDFDF